MQSGPQAGGGHLYDPATCEPAVIFDEIVLHISPTSCVLYYKSAYVLAVKCYLILWYKPIK